MSRTREPGGSSADGSAGARLGAQPWIVFKARPDAGGIAGLRRALGRGEAPDPAATFLARHSDIRPESLFAGGFLDDSAHPALAADPIATLGCVRVDDTLLRGEMLRILAGDTRVEYAHEPATRDLLRADAPQPDDPQFTSQWNLGCVGFPEVWPVLDRVGTRVSVAVIDSGIDLDHEDLPRPLRYETFGSTKEDLRGHGTSVCGVLCAVRGNGVGIAGAIDCDLSVYKVLDVGGWVWRRYYDALRRIPDDGIQVANVSLGGAVEDPTETLLLRRCITKGVGIVAAMGNDARRGDPVIFPAGIPGVVAVGAVDSDRRRCRFSSTGDHIRVSAPGDGIPTTGTGNRYLRARGTSFAAPHVSAAWAAALMVRPDLDASTFREHLSGSATATEGWSRELGDGVLNVAGLLERIR
ncbi:MAG TPA: S8 family serine peptidase [Longimicrobium sp.]|nr:S8 family serine peptidase [Longimicrobium sp.]